MASGAKLGLFVAVAAAMTVAKPLAKAVAKGLVRLGEDLKKLAEEPDEPVKAERAEDASQAEAKAPEPPKAAEPPKAESAPKAAPKTARKAGPAKETLKKEAQTTREQVEASIRAAKQKSAKKAEAPKEETPAEEPKAKRVRRRAPDDVDTA